MKLYLINTSPKSQAHCLVTQADTQPKPGKELALPMHEQTGIKHETLTRYIKHLAESANFKSGTFNKLCNGLIGKRFEMPNVSYTQPLAVILERYNPI